MTPFYLALGSWSLGLKSSCFKVLFPLKCVWIIYLPELAYNKLIGPPQEDQESLSTQIKEGSVHSKQQPSSYSVWCNTTYSQVSHNQRTDFTKLSWWLWGYWMLTRSPISYSDRSKYYLQADILQPNPSAFKKKLSNTKLTNAQSRCNEARTWGHLMD